MAQLVKHLALDFGSGHDLIVHEFKPHIRIHTDSVEPAWDSLPLSLPLPICALFLSQNKLLKKQNKKKNNQKVKTT